LQGGGEVARVHAPDPEQFPAAGFVEPGTGAGQSLGFAQGVDEGQVLQGVQGIVMDEIAQGRLRRQQMGDVLQAGCRRADESRPAAALWRLVCKRCGRSHSDPNGRVSLASEEAIRPSSGAG
jgi:hypothetical protein